MEFPGHFWALWCKKESGKLKICLRDSIHSAGAEGAEKAGNGKEKQAGQEAVFKYLKNSCVQTDTDKFCEDVGGRPGISG